MGDQRPDKCRFRLIEEGKPYPKSSCTGCGRSILTVLGDTCPLLGPTPPNPTPSPAVGREEIARVLCDAQYGPDLWDRSRQEPPEENQYWPTEFFAVFYRQADAILALIAPGETEATLRAEVERLRKINSGLVAQANADNLYGARLEEQLRASTAERDEALREVERLTQEGFHLAANQCEGPMQMGEGGHAYCPVVENVRAERDRLSEEKRVLREALSKGAMTMESNGPRQHYEIRIRFTGLDDMHTAGRALVTARDLNQESPNGNP